MSEDTPSPSPQRGPQQRLVLHRQRHLAGTTVRLGGFAWEDCVFEGCTIVVSNTPFAIQRVRFNACVFRLEYDLPVGDQRARSQLRQLLDVLDGAPDANGSFGV